MRWQKVGNYLDGAIPRLEANPAQVDTISQAQTVDIVMLDLPQARRVDQTGIDLTKIDAEILLSSTIPDEELEEWFPERQLELAQRIGASAIVPCDRPVYSTDSRARRLETIRTYVADLRDIVPEFREVGVDVIPLVKGESEYERGLCYDVFDNLDCSRVAYYCVQYFSYGFRYKELLNRIQRISIEHKPDNMMLIGLQSENLASDLPPCVSSLAGQRWRRKTNPREASVEIAAREYDHWSRQVDSVLSTGQAPLHAFEDGRGWA